MGSVTILGTVWLDVEKNENGIYKLAIDVDNSVISLNKEETKLKYNGVNNLLVGDKFKFEGVVYEMIDVQMPEVWIEGLRGSKRHLFDVRDVIKLKESF